MGPAQRHRELVAHLAPQGASLGKPQVVGVGGASSTDQTRLRCHEFEMGFVAVAARLADGEFALLDFCGTGVGLSRRRIGWLVIDGWLRGD